MSKRPRPRSPSSASGDRRVRSGVRLAQVDELELEIDQLVAGGEGLARFEGIPIFVPRSAPGDLLRVRLVERRPDYGRAEIVEILAPGPGRRQPPCPHYSRCGGCDLQHLEDDVQVELKTAAVRETLARLGGIDPSLPVKVISGSPWAYRSRTQLQIGRQGERLRVGYFARRSHDLVAVDCCPILVPELEALLAELPDRLPVDGPRRLDLAAGEDGSLSTAPVVAGLPHGELSVTVGEFTYRYDARCFFQTHQELLPELVDGVVGDWSGEQAYDLYCGVGLFSLPLARRYRRLVAVEGDRVAARYARGNSRRHRLTQIEMLNQAVESWIRQLPEDAERVVVDPPRSGLSAVVRRQLRARRPRRLTYVSCHAGTLARDLKFLAPFYRLESLTLLDLFPQTGHMEVVAQLRVSQPR